MRAGDGLTGGELGACYGERRRWWGKGCRSKRRPVEDRIRVAAAKDNSQARKQPGASAEQDSWLYEHIYPLSSPAVPESVRLPPGPGAGNLLFTTITVITVSKTVSILLLPVTGSSQSREKGCRVLTCRGHGGVPHLIYSIPKFPLPRGKGCRGIRNFALVPASVEYPLI